MRVSTFLFVSSCQRSGPPTRLHVQCPVDPIVVIQGERETRTLTFLCQAHSERTDGRVEELKIACAGPAGVSQQSVIIKNEDAKSRLLWTNPIEIKMEFVPGEYEFAIGQQGRIDARCWVMVARQAAGDN